MPRKTPEHEPVVLPEGAVPHSMLEWDVVAWPLEGAQGVSTQLVEAERCYVTEAALTFMVGSDIILSIAHGAWRSCRMRPRRYLVPSP